LLSEAYKYAFCLRWVLDSWHSRFEVIQRTWVTTIMEKIIYGVGDAARRVAYAR